MSMMRWIAAVALACGALAACSALFGKELDPRFCAAHPDDRECRGDGGQRCTTSRECAAPLVCDVTDTQTCVACTAAEAGACTGTAPVCGDDHACRGCAAHAECGGSGVCLPDGACADAAQVAYVAPGGTGAQPCTQSAPCGTLQEGVAAVAAGRPYVKIVGTGTLADTKTTTIDGKAVTILADPGAKLDRTGDGVILEVRNTGADVRLYDLEITGASGAAGDVGISVPAGGMPKLTLTRVRVTNNVGGGLSVNGGTVTVSQSTISGNTGGGLSITGAQFDLVNNMIVKNGSAGSAYGGVRIDSIVSSGMYRFDFNTVSDNVGPAVTPTGVTCTVVTQPLTFSSNVVYDNQTGGSRTQVGGANCTWGYSDIGPGGMAGTGNLDAAPLFVDVVQGNFHLQAGSPAKDAADPAASLGVDIDGDPRPQGAARDMGADEIR